MKAAGNPRRKSLYFKDIKIDTNGNVFLSYENGDTSISHFEDNCYNVTKID